MTKPNVIRFGLIGGTIAVLGSLSTVIAQGLWAATQTPSSFYSVMFGA
ncbi:MAG: hypothetical protein OQJ97_18095 [Rhodospirillales bacterium]|nr:hypothetical protein [Rhodospirillales bacterium]